MSKGYNMNFGSKGMSGKVLQYLTLQTKSVVLLSPACCRLRSRSPFWGGFIVGAITTLCFSTDYLLCLMALWKWYRCMRFSNLMAVQLADVLLGGRRRFWLLNPILLWNCSETTTGVRTRHSVGFMGFGNLLKSSCLTISTALEVLCYYHWNMKKVK